jgi:hypothetical protein
LFKVIELVVEVVIEESLACQHRDSTLALWASPRDGKFGQGVYSTNSHLHLQSFEFRFDNFTYESCSKYPVALCEDILSGSINP